MSGTIPLSMTQQFDVYGRPLAGGQLYIIQVGTVSTPQDAFQDTGLVVKQPYPMTLDAAGRVPQFFLADGSVKIRLQDKNGVVQLSSDSVLVIGPSAGGGGAGTVVDTNALIQTGNLIFRYSTGAFTGYVRLNGLTIGSVTSGATERANADTQALFLHLWGVDTTLAVSGGRGANAAADWTANKQIALPDFRGYAVGGLDGMGNSLAARLTTPFFGAANPDLLGSVGGGESLTLGLTHIPAGLGISGTAASAGSHSHTYTDASVMGSQKPNGTGTAPFAGTVTGTTSTDGAHTHPVSGSVTGAGGLAHRTIGPRKLVTFYIKL